MSNLLPRTIMDLDLGFVCEVIRSPRRRITISFGFDNKKVQIAIPAKFPQRRLEELVRKNEKWFKSQLAKQIINDAKRPKERKFNAGDVLLFLGKKYQLKFIDVSNKNIAVDNEKIIVPISKTLNEKETKQYVKEALQNWYIDHASNILISKTKYYANIIGVKPKGIKLGDYKTKWGSCSSKNKLAYSWRIVMAPEVIVDYLVVHELCHMKEHNHSARFWKLVENYLPDYQVHKKWLRTNESQLSYIYEAK